MSSNSPTIVGGLVDTSAMFGRSILDVGVPYPADMAQLPTSTPNPGAMKRKTRRSWFETTPSGTKIEIAVEKPEPPKKVLSGEVEVLTLTHFTAAPRLDFGTMKPGQVKVCTLLLRNPHECEQSVRVERVPEKKHFTVVQKSFTVAPGETFPLEVTWSPPDPGNFREMILIHVDKTYRLQAYVFGTVTAPPQKKKKRRVGLLATKVSKPFSVIQTPGLASINHQYSPDKNRRSSGENRKIRGTMQASKENIPKFGRSGEAVRRSGETARRSGEAARMSGETTRRSGEATRRSGETARRSGETARRSGEAARRSGESRRSGCTTRRSTEKTQVLGETTTRRSSRLSGQGDLKEESTKFRNNLKKGNVRDNKENVEDRIPKKKMRRSNTYSNVSSQGLVIPVIHGDTVQGQMDTSLIDIVDKCNVSGIEPLEQSFVSPELQKYSDTIKEGRGVSVHEKPSFLEVENKGSPNLDAIVSQIIPCEGSEEPSFLVPNGEVAGDGVKTTRTRNKKQVINSNDTFNNSLDSVSHDVQGNVEQPSFLSPQDVSLRRSTRRSGGRVDTDQGGDATEVKLLKSLKRRSGRRSITKENKRSSLNKSAGSKSILEQLKNLRSFIKEKSFEIESGDEPSFMKHDQDPAEPVQMKEVSFLTESPSLKKTGHEVELRRETYLAETYKVKDSGREQELRRDTFLTEPSKIKLLETQKPSEASPRRTTFTVIRKTPNHKSPARSRSEGNKPQRILTALDEALNEAEEMSKEGSDDIGLVDQPVERNKAVNSVKQTKGVRTASESPKRLFSADSLENDSFEPVFTPPKQLKLEIPELFERRATLTVTKSRPSDALLDQMKKQTSTLFKAEETFETTQNDTESVDMIKPSTAEVTNTCQPNQNNTFDHSQHKEKTNSLEANFPSTPHQIPTSPNLDHSRRSTHVLKDPRLVNLNAIEQRELFQDSLDDSNKENKVPEVLPGMGDSIEDSSLPDSPANNTRRRLSAKRSISNLKTGNANTSKSSSVTQLDDSSSKHTSTGNIVDESSNMADTKVVEKVTEPILIEEKVERKENHGLVFIPFDDKNADQATAKMPIRPKTKVDPKQFLKKRGNPLPVALTTDMPKRMKKEVVDVPKKPVTAKAAVAKKPVPAHADVQKNLVASVNMKKPSKVTQAAVKEAKTGLNTRPVAKQKSNMVKGIAQSKLILMKKSKTALPKHPMPFAAKNMYYDERWMEKQERGFVNWLNFILTPADEYQGNDVKVKVDAGKLAVDVAKGSVKLAPTNEVLSFRAYSAHRKLNRLRKSACRLFQSESVIRVIQKLEGEVESGRLAVRKDKMLHADIGLKQKILDTLLCYNPLWLRIGIETIYGEVVPLQSNSDVFGLSRFILTRLLTSPEVNQEFAHPTVPHLYRDGYAEATAVHSLKKFLMLVYFLDRAKQERLIDHNPCLFCKNSDVKSSKDVLQHFSRDYLSGEGDIIRHLGYLGYKVTYIQTALDEFDFAVSKLGTDLRDGLRLTKVLEMMCSKPDLSRTLRVPAISRLQKVHNVEVVFKALAEANIHTDSVVARDVVDGHREKTLRLLWNIILHYQVEILLNEAQLREEINILEKSLKVKHQLQKFLKYSCNNKSKRESEGPDLHTQNPRLNLLLKWCRAVCAFYNIKIENFTVSFSDGRALCHIVNYYHPGLLPLNMIKTETSMTHLESMERNTTRSVASSFNDSFDSSAAFGDTEDPEVYERLLNNEKENFKVLFEKVKELGGIPLMLKWSDMSNTIPDEKVVVTYLLYLCARLLDIRHESRAARIIQLAWRKYRLKAAEAEFEVKNKAALKIQKHVKYFLARRRTERMSEAALLLQRVWRGYLARKRVSQLKLDLVMCKQIQAVQTLQRAVTSYLHRRRYLKMKSAVIQFQARCRGYLVRRQRHNAACIIQSAMRSYLARRNMEKMRSSVVCLQSCVRGYIVRRRMAEYKQAVITIQRRYRANLARRVGQKKFECLRKSCVVIQKCWRNYQSRKAEKEICAAVTIQAVFRGYVERVRYLRLKSSAVAIQAAVRGYIQRKYYLRQKKAVTTIQNYFKTLLCARKQRTEYHELRQTVIFLQSQRRMMVQKREYECMKKSCIIIQRYWRNYQTRKVDKKICAAVTIQAAYRGYVERVRYLRLKSSTVSIQATVRGFLQRKYYLQQKKAATTIQSYFKNLLCARQERMEYQKLRQTVIFLQSKRRMIVQKREYETERQAVIKVQSIVRMFLEKRRFLRLREAVCTLQKFCQVYKCRRKYLISVGATITLQAGVRGYIIRKVLKHRHMAATVIQAFVRKTIQQRKYRGLKIAVIQCQRRVRAGIAGRDQQQRYQALQKATVTTQKLVRGRQCRKQYLKDRETIVKAQGIVRSLLARRSYLKLRNAAVYVQRRYRAKQLGENCRQDLQRVSQATTVIQSGYRGYCVRKELKKRHAAATIIQSHVRAILQKQKFVKIRAATIHCQRRVIAKLAAKQQKMHYSYLKRAAIVIQKRVRGWMCRVNYQTSYNQVVKVQSVCRMVIERRRFLEQREAVQVLQTRFRAMQLGNMCRQRYTEVKQAAITLQSAYRGLKVRREIHRQHIAAICIQKYVKRFCQRKTFLKKKAAVISLQKRFRAKQLGNICKQQYDSLKQAVITLQAAFRGYKAWQEVHRQHTAAVCIQKNVKRYCQRKMFLKKKTAVGALQMRFRARQLGNICKQRYDSLKRATITIQAAFRGYKARQELHRQHTAAVCIQKHVKRYCQRKTFLKKKTAVTALQKRFRAIQLGNICKQRYDSLKQAAITLQAAFRGYKARQEVHRQHTAAVCIQKNVKGYFERKQFLAKKGAALVLQRRFQAKQLSKLCEQKYNITKQAAIKLQSAFRGYRARRSLRRQNNAAVCIQKHVKGYCQRKQFSHLKKAVIAVQRIYCAKREGKKCRIEYLEKKSAALAIQSVYRGYRVRRDMEYRNAAATKIQSAFRRHTQQRNYLKLKATVKVCQSLYRAKVARYKEQQNYVKMRTSVVKIQSAYRAFICRRQYNMIRTSAVKIQSIYRGYRAMRAYSRIWKATVVLQTHWRAELSCRQQWLKYRTLRDAALLVQRKFRARKVRQNYLQMKTAIITLQTNIRMWTARREVDGLRRQRECERTLYLDRVARVTRVNLSAIQIQRCYRNHQVMKVANAQLHSVTLIQRWIRSKLRRIHYLRDRARIICLQRRVRDWLVKRHNAATVIQCAVRRWRPMLVERKKIRAASRIQALWRGYNTRRSSTSKKLASARKRVLEANALATEEKKLCNRTTSALDFLLKYKQMHYVLDALQHLEVATRLSWSCCEKMVASNAVPVLYKLLRSCNRSLPHMEIVKFTVDILLNLAKYEKTRMSLYTEEECFPALVEMMQIYREKQGTIFIKTCTLMGIMSMDSACKMAILKDKKLTDKLQSFHKLTARKHKLEENQRVTRAKMNATFNSTFVVRSPLKKHKIKPDWALHKDKMKDIESPLKAINFLLTNLALAIK